MREVPERALVHDVDPAVADADRTARLQAFHHLALGVRHFAQLRMARMDRHRGGRTHARIGRTALAAAFLAAGAAMAGCVPEGSGGEEQAAAGLPDPAAVFCVESGGIYEIRRAADGSQSGVCTLADGTEVDAWTRFRDKAPPE